MSRTFPLLTALIAAAAGRADAPLVVVGDPLPPGAVARFGLPGGRWGGAVFAGGHTPAGSLRVAVARGKDVRVWAWQPAHARPPAHTLAGHAADVTHVALSPDARFLASADKAGEVRLWELATGTSGVLKEAGDAVTALAVGPGGRRAAVAAGRVVMMHDLAASRMFRVGDHDRDVTALAFAPAGGRLATADALGRVRVWKSNGVPVMDLPWDPYQEPDPPAPPRHARLLNQLGAGGQPARVIDFGRGVRKLAFSSDGRRLAATGGTVVRVWQIDERRVLWQHNGHARIHWSDHLREMGSAVPRGLAGPRQVGGVTDVAFSRDGRYVASTGTSGDIRIVHAEHGEDFREPLAAERARGTGIGFDGRVGLAFGPDGRSLTLFDGAGKFYRETVERGEPLGRVAAHGASVAGLAVSPDGKWLATAADYTGVQVWRIASGECVAHLRPGHYDGRGIAFSPDSKWLVGGGTYHGFTVLAKRGDPPVFCQRNQYDVLRWRAHAFVPGHGARLHVCSQYGQSRSIDLDDRKEHGPGFTVSNEPRDLAVSPDGKWVAVAFGYSSTPAPRVFAAATGKERPPLEGAAALWAVDVIRFSPDSRLLAGGGRSGTTLWEVATGKKYLHLGPNERTTRAVAFSPDGRLLAAGADGEVLLHEVATGRLLGTRRADERAVLSLAFLPQPGRLVSGGTAGDVLVWDVSRELARAAPVPKDLGRGVTAPAECGQWARRFPVEQAAGGLAFSPDGKTLAAGTRTGRILLYDFESGKLTNTLAGHTSEVRTVLYTPDGKSILSTGHLFGDKDLPVRAWDAATGTPRWARGGTGTFPDAIEVTPDGKTVYTTGNKGIPWWDVRTGEPLGRVKAYDGTYTGGMALSPDGRYLMVGGQRDVVLWDLTADRAVRTWQATDSDRDYFVQALAFSPDSNTAVTTASDGRVRVWDVVTGEMRHWWGLGGPVSAAVFSPKADLIAFAGDMRTSGMSRVRLWDVRTGKELLRLIAQGPRVAWSPDGRWLATADARFNEKENYVLVWDIDTMLGR